MTPPRHWPPDDLRRPVWPSDGDYPLPSVEEALQASLRAFPSWFLRIECERCNKVRMLNEAHVTAGRAIVDAVTSQRGKVRSDGRPA